MNVFPEKPMYRWTPQLVLILILLLQLLTTTACYRSPENQGGNGPGDSAGKNNSDPKSSAGDGYTGKSLDTWPVVFDEMQRVLEMSDDETELLQQTMQMHVQKIKAFYEEHGPTIAQADRDVKQAATSKDLTRLREITQAAKPLREQANVMLKDMDAAVMSALSNSNQVAWKAHRLTARFLELAESLNLSDAQRQRIGELAIDAARQARNDSNPQAAGLLALEKQIEAQVLDADQRMKYAEIKEDNKLRSLKTYASYQPTRTN